MIIQPELQILVYGEVSTAFQEGLRVELESCYRRLPSQGLGIVRVRLVDTVRRLREISAAEQAELGIINPPGEEFLATHDAWTGVPRITVCEERIKGITSQVFRGAIRHEVAHTILHGSIEYYIFKLSREILAKGKERGFDAFSLQQLLYYAAIAVKDYEVTSLLVKHGYAESQVALAIYQMEIGEEDEMVWFIARANPVSRLIFLASMLKPLLFIHPLLDLPAFSRKLEEESKTMLSFLPSKEREDLSKLVERIVSSLGDDTHKNVETAFRFLLEGV
jgi:hypothetical protein